MIAYENRLCVWKWPPRGGAEIDEPTQHFRDEPIWSPTTFSKNRDRLLQADVASAFFDAV